MSNITSTQSQREPRMVMTSLYLPPELHQKFKQVSKRTTIPLGMMARLALVEKYAKELAELEAKSGDASA